MARTKTDSAVADPQAKTDNSDVESIDAPANSTPVVKSDAKSEDEQIADAHKRDDEAKAEAAKDAEKRDKEQAEALKKAADAKAQPKPEDRRDVADQRAGVDKVNRDWTVQSDRPYLDYQQEVGQAFVKAQLPDREVQKAAGIDPDQHAAGLVVLDDDGATEDVYSGPEPWEARDLGLVK